MGDGHKIEEMFPPWVLWVGIGLAVSCACLVALWYLKHPDRNILEDFAHRTVDIPSTNGAVHHAEATVGPEAVEGP